jgi:hypothetical protein
MDSAWLRDRRSASPCYLPFTCLWLLEDINLVSELHKEKPHEAFSLGYGIMLPDLASWDLD